MMTFNSELEKLREITNQLVENGYLLERSAQWEFAFDAIPDFVVIVNSKFLVKFANKTLLKRLGVKNYDLIDKQCPMKFNSSGCNGDCCASLTNEDSLRYVNKPDMYIESLKSWFDFTRTPIFDEEDGLIGYLCILRDVTDRKLVEDALQKSEERYKYIFKKSKPGVAVYKTVDEGKDFVFVDYNEAAEKIEGQKREDLIGRSIFDARPGIDEFGLISVLQEVWKTGKPIHHPRTYYRDEKLKGWYENFVYKSPSDELVAIFTRDVGRREISG